MHVSHFPIITTGMLTLAWRPHLSAESEFYPKLWPAARCRNTGQEIKQAPCFIVTVYWFQISPQYKSNTRCHVVIYCPLFVWSIISAGGQFLQITPLMSNEQKKIVVLLNSDIFIYKFFKIKENQTIWFYLFILKLKKYKLFYIYIYIYVYMLKFWIEYCLLEK